MPFNLTDLLSNFASQTQLNNNFSSIEDEVNGNLLKRNNPRGDANEMQVDIDMNGNSINNTDSLSTASITLSGETFNSRNDLKGDKGDTGDTGPQGAPGQDSTVPGPKGDTGTSFQTDETVTYKELIEQTSVVDDRSFLVVDYGSPTMASLSSGQVTVRIAKPEAFAGHQYYARIVNTATTGGQGYLTWSIAGLGGSSPILGVENGDYLEFVLTPVGVPTQNYVIIEAVSDVGSVPYYEANSYQSYMFLSCQEYVDAFDGNGTLDAIVVGGYVIIKNGAGPAQTLADGTVAIDQPSPFQDQWYREILFGSASDAAAANAQAAADAAQVTASTALANAATAQSSADSAQATASANTGSLGILTGRVTNTENDITALQGLIRQVGNDTYITANGVDIIRVDSDGNVYFAGAASFNEGSV